MKISTLLLAATLILLSGCAMPPAEATPTSIPLVPATVAALTPTIPPATFTPIPPSATPTETVTPTSTPDAHLAVNCLDILPSAPANFTTKGILLLGNYQTRDTLFVNLESGDKDSIPSLQKYVGVTAMSPDRKTLAYYSENSLGISLILTDAINTKQRVLFTGKTDFAFYAWLNSQDLLLGKNDKWHYRITCYEELGKRLAQRRSSLES